MSVLHQKQVLSCGKSYYQLLHKKKIADMWRKLVLILRDTA